MLYFTVTGYLLGLYEIIKFIEKFKLKIVLLSLLVYKIAVKCSIFIKLKGIAYYGINLNIQAIYILFLYLPYLL